MNFYKYFKKEKIYLNLNNFFFKIINNVLYYWVYLFIFVFYLIVKLFKLNHKLIVFFKKNIFKINFSNWLFMISCLLFILVLFLWIRYDPMQGFLQNKFSIKILNYYFYFYLDGISLVFLFLTSFFIPLCIFYTTIKSNISLVNEYSLCLLSVEILLFFVFLVSDLVLFFISFETILIPFFFIIGLLGSRSKKIHASYLLFFYTLIGSLLMLVSILFIYLHTGSTLFQVLWVSEFSSIRENFLWFSFFFSFAVKVPMVPLHIWLPEAHVESPTESSVLLAAVLLKVGGYGFLRIVIPSFPNASFYFSNICIVISIVSVLYSSLSTLRQLDIKRIIAYSSVAHMNIVMIGIFTLDPIGILGSIILMVAHGIVSGALFFSIGMLYDRCKTKIIVYYSGFVEIMPLLSFFFFFFIISNMGMPSTCNFVGEFLVIIGLSNISNYFMLFTVFISIFFCSVYSILLYNKIFFGLFISRRNEHIKDLNLNELYILLILLFFLFLIGIYPTIICNILIYDISYLFI